MAGCELRVCLFDVPVGHFEALQARERRLRTSFVDAVLDNPAPDPAPSPAPDSAPSPCSAPDPVLPAGAGTRGGNGRGGDAGRSDGEDGESGVGINGSGGGGGGGGAVVRGVVLFTQYSDAEYRDERADTPEKWHDEVRCDIASVRYGALLLRWYTGTRAPIVPRDLRTAAVVYLACDPRACLPQLSYFECSNDAFVCCEHAKVGQFYSGRVYREDLLPVPSYLARCVAAFEGIGALDNLLDHSFLGTHAPVGRSPGGSGVGTDGCTRASSGRTGSQTGSDAGAGGLGAGGASVGGQSGGMSLRAYLAAAGPAAFELR